LKATGSRVKLHKHNPAAEKKIKKNCAIDRLRYICSQLITNIIKCHPLACKGQVVCETAKFQELPNKRTKIIVQTVFKSVADGDDITMLASG
jgi:hypothetical protein